LEHPGLRQALLEKLFDDMKDEVKITTKSPVPDRTTLARIEQAATRLVQTGKYCPKCAAQAIYHVGGLLNR
jgi:serine protein kinase